MSIRKSFPSSSFPYNKKHCGVEGAEKALSYTHVHKIINVSVLYMEYRLTDFDVDQSFTLPCSVSYLSIHTAVTKPLFPYIKECKDGGGGGGGERKIFLLLMYIKLPMHLFCTSNIKSWFLLQLCIRNNLPFPSPPPPPPSPSHSTLFQVHW